MIGNSDDETNFPDKLLLTNRQVVNLRKAFSNDLSNDIKLSKTQLSKMIPSDELLGRFLGPLLNAGSPLAKIVLIQLGLTAAASAADAGIHKKLLQSGTATLIIPNAEMEDIMRIVKSLEDSGLLLQGVSATIQNEAKEQKGGFLSILLGTLGASLLENVLAGKEITKTGYDSKGRKGIIISGNVSKLDF